jgi:anti-sigma regulatory factor (Ser/Thr protein kinase)
MIAIRMTSDPRLLSIVRAMVGQLCDVCDCSTDDQRKIVLAVDEACTNVIRHTYHFDPGGSLEISCNGGEDLLEIVLQDCGPPMDLERIRPRDLAEIRPGGLGTHFIRTVMDEVDYAHREGGGNTLRMVKRLKKISEEE